MKKEKTVDIAVGDLNGDVVGDFIGAMTDDTEGKFGS